MYLSSKHSKKKYNHTQGNGTVLHRGSIQFLATLNDKKNYIRHFQN